LSASTLTKKLFICAISSDNDEDCVGDSNRNQYRVSHMIKNNIILLLFIVFSILVHIPSSAARGLPTSDAEPGHQAEIESRLYLGHPDVMRTAVTMARDYPGEFSINQVSAIYRHLVEEKTWNYFNDPSSQEYYKYANQTLEDGYRAGTEAVGDCDDFAILMASLVESLHGTARIIFAHDEQTDEDHAYAQLYVGENGDPIVAKIENFIKDEWGVPSVPGLSRSDDNSLWLNLDYNATYPGGFVFGGEMADIEVAWTSGNRTSPKIVPLIDSMDSLASWEVVKDGIGSNISIKNALSRTGKAIEISYDLREGGFVGISRDVDPKVLAELEGINFTYRKSSEPAILELVLNDQNNTNYSISWNLKGDENDAPPMWTYLAGYYNDFHRANITNTNSSESRLNRSNIRNMKFIIHRGSQGDISGNGCIAIDQIRGLLRIPKDSIWNLVKSEREKAMAVQLAFESERARSNPLKLIESMRLAVESLNYHETLEGEMALRRNLNLLPRCIAQFLHNDPFSIIAFSPDGRMLATRSDNHTDGISVRSFGSSRLVIMGSVNSTICIWDIKTGLLLQRLKHDSQVLTASFSPDSSKLATGSDDGIARLWDVRTGQEMQKLENNAQVLIVTFSRDGSKLATGGDDGLARLWDVRTGTVLHNMSHDGYVSTVAFNPNGTILVTGSKDRTARIWDVQTGAELHKLMHEYPVSKVTFNPDGTMLATEGEDKTAYIWVVKTGKQLHKLADYGAVLEVVFSPNGIKLATSKDNAVSIWNVQNGRELNKLEYDGSKDAVVFSPNFTEMAAVGSFDNTVTVWDMNTGREMKRLVHDDRVNSLCFNPNGTWLAVGSDDGNARIWDIVTGPEIREIGHGDLVSTVAFSSDGSRLASGSFDNTTRIWDSRTGQELQIWDNHAPVLDVDFSPDGTKLAAGCSDSFVRIWDVKSGMLLRKLKHNMEVHSVAFHPDGTKLVSGSWDNSARLWDVQNGLELRKFEHNDSVWSVAFNPDGRRLATGCEDGIARIWDTQTGHVIQRLNHSDIVYSVAFSADGLMLATGSEDRTARFWNVTTGQQMHKPYIDDIVLSWSFSSDGSMMAGGGIDGNAHIWDVKTDQEMQRLEHDSWVWAVAFSPDGSKLATGSSDGIVRIWGLGSKDLICEACSRLRFNLTTQEWRAQYCLDF
jgi:WD40 repeat protein